MVIDNLDIEGVATLEPEAHAPLVVDADAVLALAVALERFERLLGGMRRSSRRVARFVHPFVAIAAVVSDRGQFWGRPPWSETRPTPSSAGGPTLQTALPSMKEPSAGCDEVATVDRGMKGWAIGMSQGLPSAPAVSSRPA